MHSGESSLSEQRVGENRAGGHRGGEPRAGEKRVEEGSAEEAFEVLVAAFAVEPCVTLPGEGQARGSGSHALKVNGSIFAMMSGGRLVVSFPRERVEELLASGMAAPFEPRPGRPMREWATVSDVDAERWLSLSREAFSFVRVG